MLLLINVVTIVPFALGTATHPHGHAGHFWLINVVFVDHAKWQNKHALFLVLSGRGVTWSDLPAP